MNFKRLPVLQFASVIYLGVVSFLLGVVIARELGPAEFGFYVSWLSAGSILAIFLDGGMSTWLRRERTRSGSSLGQFAARIPAIALGQAVTLAALVTLLAIAVEHGEWKATLSGIACFLGVVLVQYVSAFLRGQGRWGVDAVWQVSQRTFSAVLILSALAFGLTAAWHVMATWAIATLIACLLFPSPLRCWPEMGVKLQVYRATLPLVLIDLCTAVYFRSDMLVLGWFDVSKQDVGQYAAAYRLFEAAILASGPFGLLLFRRIRLFEGDPQALRRSLILYVATAAAVGVAVALAMHAAAELLLGWSYGPLYPDSSGLLRVICWGLVFVLPNIVLTQAALAMERDRAYLWAAALAALTNVAMNCALVPWLGTGSAAYTTVATEAVLFICLALSLLGQRSPAQLT